MLNKLKKNNEARGGTSSLFFIVLGCICLFVAGGLCVYGLGNWETRESAKVVEETLANMEPEEEETLEYNGQVYKRNENIETVIIMGLDKYQEQVDEESEYEDLIRNHQQADFISLLVMDKETGESRILQLNRDTMVNMPIYDIFGKSAGTTYGQLALAHTYGTGKRDSCRNVASAVSDLLGGVQIDHYISLTMDSVAEINDAVGGVTVKVNDDFSAVDPSLVQGEKVTLMGDQALTYVRSRMNVDDGTNLSRMKRQQQYLDALYDKVADLAETDSAALFSLVFKISPYMVSDCSANTLSQILDTYLSGKNRKIETIDGEAVQGEVYIEFYPDKDALQEKIVDLFWVPVEEETAE